MGFLIWLGAGLVVWAAVRLLLGRPGADTRAPGLTTSLLAAILGGYLGDLMLRGDSVLHFRGPTLIGAVMGVLVLMVVENGVAWATRSSHRSA